MVRHESNLIERRTRHGWHTYQHNIPDSLNSDNNTGHDVLGQTKNKRLKQWSGSHSKTIDTWVRLDRYFHKYGHKSNTTTTTVLTLHSKHRLYFK